MDLDNDKIAEGAMAILALTMFKDGPVHRAWKGIDWDVLEDLFHRGWIHDPKGKAKSVVFTDKGRELATEFMARQFGVVVQHARRMEQALLDPRRLNQMTKPTVDRIKQV